MKVFTTSKEDLSNNSEIFLNDYDEIIYRLEKYAPVSFKVFGGCITFPAQYVGDALASMDLTTGKISYDRQPIQVPAYTLVIVDVSSKEAGIFSSYITDDIFKSHDVTEFSAGIVVSQTNNVAHLIDISTVLRGKMFCSFIKDFYFVLSSIRTKKYKFLEPIYNFETRLCGSSYNPNRIRIKSKAFFCSGHIEESWYDIYLDDIDIESVFSTDTNFKDLIVDLFFEAIFGTNNTDN